MHVSAPNPELGRFALYRWVANRPKKKKKWRMMVASALYVQPVDAIHY